MWFLELGVPGFSIQSAAYCVALGQSFNIIVPSHFHLLNGTVLRIE